MEDMPVSAFYQSKAGAIEVTGKEGFIEKIAFIESIPDINSKNIPGYMQECLSQLDDYFNYKLKEFNIKIRLNGTEFQRRVWNELIKIPYGKTISYLQLAYRLGDPKLIRAAASANGKNKLAILVPCHRVIGANGDLIGYAGGLWRKKILLKHEQMEDELSLF